MPQFRLMGGVHEEGGKRFKVVPGRPGPVFDSEIDLDKKFGARKFARVGEEAQSVRVENLGRRTYQSEVQDLPAKEGRRNLGNNQVIGIEPPDDYEDPDAILAETLDDEERESLAEFKENLMENRKAKAERLKAEGEETQAQRKKEADEDGVVAEKVRPAGSHSLAGKAQAEEEDEEEDSEEEEEEEADTEEEEEEEEDVTGDFVEAKAAKVKVAKADGMYVIRDKSGDVVGKKAGYSTKKEVVAQLKKAGKK